jgi:LAS superfamily LD-carboxypeptidase LdcB
MPLDPRQLTGRDDSHLVALPDGHRLQTEVAEAFRRLQSEAEKAGFDLAIASSFRSFDRQLQIWNDKAAGRRPVHDDRGRPVAMAALSDSEKVQAILRYSALPGASRHHWGTDLDVYDAAALEEPARLRLVPEEVAPGGIFGPLHRWLDERMAAGESHGFYRPYGRDCGGVAPERWHLSYAPLSVACAGHLDAALLRRCWHGEPGSGSLLLRSQVEASLDAILRRYVAVEESWCPACYRD